MALDFDVCRVDRHSIIRSVWRDDQILEKNVLLVYKLIPLKFIIEGIDLHGSRSGVIKNGDNLSTINGKESSFLIFD